MKSAILATFSATLVAAQRYTYTTSMVTECFTSTPTTVVGPSQPTPTKGADGYYTIDMPECRNCGCSDCAYTHTYTSTYDVFAPTGLAPSAYSVKEVYRGMTTTPDAPTGVTSAAVTATAVPYGFTADIETCSVCGNQPVVGTMTYPIGGKPYASTMTNIPTAAPANPTASTLAQVPSPVPSGGSAGTSGIAHVQPTATGPAVITGAASTRSVGTVLLAVILPFAMML